MKKLILLFSLASQNLIAAEADNFTAASLIVHDVKEDLNTLANDYLKKAVSDVNLKGSCNEEKSEEALYTELRKYFGNHSKGQLVKDVLYTEKILKNTLPLKQSVYGQWDKSDGFLLGRKKAASSALALSPLIRVGDQVIGVDKLEHMFGMGFSYFKKHHQQGKEIQKVLKHGVLLEKTILGGNFLATGVFAYGDLSANFNGMRFWNHMLQKQDDILGSEFNQGPYITCQGKHWKVNEEKLIDFSHYVDSSFDESINCSKFANAGGTRKFKAAINERGFSGCPVDSQKLDEMKAKYDHKNIGRYIINSKGSGEVSYLNEFQD